MPITNYLFELFPIKFNQKVKKGVIFFKLDTINIYFNTISGNHQDATMDSMSICGEANNFEVQTLIRINRLLANGVCNITEDGVF